MLGTGLMGKSHPMTVAATALFEVEGLMLGSDTIYFYHIPVSDARLHNCMGPDIPDASLCNF